MFASLKNKIREETGSDISKLTAKITATTAQKLESLRAHRSHQGSTSSINSIVSSEAAADDCSNESLKSEEDYRRRLSKVETDYGRKLEDKERELQEVISEKEGRIRAAERERDEAKHQACGLKDSLRIAESKSYFINQNLQNRECPTVVFKYSRAISTNEYLNID